LDSGQGAEFFEDAVVEAGAVFVFGEGLALQVDVSGDDVVGGESAIEGGEIGEAFCEESGDEQKRGAGEDLGPDEGAAEKIAAAGASGTAAALEGLCGLDA
jgi:hypothetical protein